MVETYEAILGGLDLGLSSGASGEFCTRAHETLEEWIEGAEGWRTEDGSEGRGGEAMEEGRNATRSNITSTSPRMDLVSESISCSCSVEHTEWQRLRC